MQEILSRIENEGLTIELWRTIEDEQIKRNIIVNYDISSIYWDLVREDSLVLMKYSQERKNVELEKTTDEIIHKLFNGIQLTKYEYEMQNELLMKRYPTKNKLIQFCNELFNTGHDIETRIFSDDYIDAELIKLRIEKNMELPYGSLDILANVNEFETIEKAIQKGYPISSFDVAEYYLTKTNDEEKINVMLQRLFQAEESIYSTRGYNLNKLLRQKKDYVIECIQKYNININPDVMLRRRSLDEKLYEDDDLNEILKAKVDNNMKLSDYEANIYLKTLDTDEEKAKFIENNINDDFSVHTDLLDTHITDKNIKINLLKKYCKEFSDIKSEYTFEELTQIIDAVLDNGGYIYTDTLLGNYIVKYKDRIGQEKIDEIIYKMFENRNYYLEPDIIRQLSSEEKILDLLKNEKFIPMDRYGIGYLKLISSKQEKKEMLISFINKDVEIKSTVLDIVYGPGNIFDDEDRDEIMKVFMQKDHTVYEDYFKYVNSKEIILEALKNYSIDGSQEIYNMTNTIQRKIHSIGSKQLYEITKSNFINKGVRGILYDFKLEDLIDNPDISQEEKRILMRLNVMHLCHSSYFNKLLSRYNEEFYITLEKDLNIVDIEKEKKELTKLFLGNNNISFEDLRHILSNLRISDEEEYKEFIQLYLQSNGEIRIDDIFGTIPMITYEYETINFVGIDYTKQEMKDIVNEALIRGNEIGVDLFEIFDENEKKDKVTQYLKNNKSKDVLAYFLKMYREDKEFIKQQIEDFLDKGESINFNILEGLAIKEEDKLEYILKNIENGARAGNSVIDMQSKDGKIKVLEKMIYSGSTLSKSFLETIPEDEKMKLLKEYIFNVQKRVTSSIINTYDLENDMRNVLSYVEKQSQRKELFIYGIENNAIRSDTIKSLLNCIYSDTIKGELLEKYFEVVNPNDKRCSQMLQTLNKVDEMIDKAKDKNRKYLLEEKRGNMQQLINETALELIAIPIRARAYKEAEESYRKVISWGEKGILPDPCVFRKVPSSKIEEFDYRIWNNLLKSVNKDLNDEEKGALVEIAYVFGLFEKDIKIARGIAKTDDEMTDEEKMQVNAWENYEARKAKVAEFINSLESTEALHEMFDGMNMDFNPKFYHFFFLNKDAIKENISLSSGNVLVPEAIYLGTIQNELKEICNHIEEIEVVYATGTPTIQQCKNYLIQIKKEIAEKKYEDIREGNDELARLCSLSGCSQQKFESYQFLFEESKSRQISSIPRIKANSKKQKIDDIEGNIITVERNKEGNDQLKVEKDGKKISFEILRMDNPRATVCGEKIFSNCCQSVGGLGESCLNHSQRSKNGGILEIRTDDGTFLGQSWCWVNGNILCFDSAELKGLDENRNMTTTQKEEYLKMIKIGYEQMAKRMLEESNKKVEEFIKEAKAKAKLDYREGSSEYREKEKEIEDKGENIKIKQVTIGHGFWDISKKLSEMYEEDGRRIKGTRDDKKIASPIENVSYLNDSNVQYELARTEGIDNKEIKSDLRIEEQMNIYTDRRRVIKQQGDIDKDVLSKIKEIEKKAHKNNMQVMQKMDMVYDKLVNKRIANMYDAKQENLKVICGEDWYYVYSENDDNIVIHDAAKSPKARFEGEENISSTEVVEAFYDIMDESIKTGKPIKAQLREDTSYALYLKMLRKGQLEQIGEERAYDFSTGGEVRYTKEELEMLEDMLREKENREKLSKDEETIMHEIECRVTDRGKKMIDRIKGKDDREEI